MFSLKSNELKILSNFGRLSTRAWLCGHVLTISYNLSDCSRLTSAYCQVTFFSKQVHNKAPVPRHSAKRPSILSDLLSIKALTISLVTCTVIKNSNFPCFMKIIFPLDSIQKH